MHFLPDLFLFLNFCREHVVNLSFSDVFCVWQKKQIFKQHLAGRIHFELFIHVRSKTEHCDSSTTSVKGSYKVSPDSFTAGTQNRTHPLSGPWLCRCRWDSVCSSLVSDLFRREWERQRGEEEANQTGNENRDERRSKKNKRKKRIHQLQKDM